MFEGCFFQPPFTRARSYALGRGQTAKDRFRSRMKPSSTGRQKTDVSLALGRLAVHAVDRKTVFANEIYEAPYALISRYWGDARDLDLLRRLRRFGSLPAQNLKTRFPLSSFIYRMRHELRGLCASPMQTGTSPRDHLFSPRSLRNSTRITAGARPRPLECCMSSCLARESRRIRIPRSD